jgi:hypothetical protein
MRWAGNERGSRIRKLRGFWDKRRKSKMQLFWEIEKKSFQQLDQ